MIRFTPEQSVALHANSSPVQALDPESKQEYVILNRDAFEKMKRMLGIDDIDPSVFEFEEIDVTVDAPRQL